MKTELIGLIFVAIVVECSFAAPPSGLRPVSEKDRAIIAPVAAGELRLRPTFACCGVCWGSPVEVPGIRLEYRRRGDAVWSHTPFPPPYFAGTGDYRASILGLEEHTEYELRLRAEDRILASGSFRTWSSRVPIAKTIVLEPDKLTFPYRIDAQGTAEGWIQYKLPRGAVLSNATAEATFWIEGAKYVLIDGVDFRGAHGGYRHEPVHIEKSQGIRVRNCEFSGWGMKNGPDWERGGQLPNWQAAVLIGKGASEIVVERCYAHDPVSRANSWRYSHPSGVEAVLMGEPDHSCVVRHCDFIGSDLHRFNDVIEGCNNGHMEGGFNRDGDAQGNFLAFANDDCIELDGGQQNVRAFGNRFEGALSGVSVQCCNAGPGYVVDNLFCEMGEEFGCANPSIKTAGIDLRNYGPPVFLCDNTFYGRGGGIETYAKLARFTIVSNVFGVGQRLIVPEGNRVIGNRTGVELKESQLDAAYPRRPLHFFLTKSLIRGVVTDGRTASPQSVDLEAVHDGQGRDVRFRVRQNDAFDWFEVSPSEGCIRKGERVAFTVRFKPERMRTRRYWRGAFIVRTPGGLSRPVTVYAENPDFVQPFEVTSSGTWQSLRLQPTVLDAAVSTNVFSVTLEVPKRGRYHVLLYGHGERRWPGDGGWKRDHVRLATTIDGAEPQSVGLQTEVFDTWMVATPGCGGFGGTRKRVELTAGRHGFGIVPRTGRLTLLGVAVVEDPGAWEPK